MQVKQGGACRLDGGGCCRHGEKVTTSEGRAGVQSWRQSSISSRTSYLHRQALLLSWQHLSTDQNMYQTELQRRHIQCVMGAAQQTTV